MTGLLADATEALSRLDGERLERLLERALAVQAGFEQSLTRERAAAMPLEDLNARLRVFARVVEATGRNLAALQPREEWRGYGMGKVAPEARVRRGTGGVWDR